uniref:Uncharacterized protein n=1 Tax=Ciona intestinalis TaxID=7719 RepID=H2Y338_CIOIN
MRSITQCFCAGSVTESPRPARTTTGVDCQYWHFYTIRPFIVDSKKRVFKRNLNETGFSCLLFNQNLSSYHLFCNLPNTNVAFKVIIDKRAD